jgi:hypothetical protein
VREHNADWQTCYKRVTRGLLVLSSLAEKHRSITQEQVQRNLSLPFNLQREAGRGPAVGHPENHGCLCLGLCSSETLAAGRLG